MPQTKVKYFVLVFLTKSFMPIPIQSPTINSKSKYNDPTLIGNNIQWYKNTIKSNAMHVLHLHIAW